MTLWGCWGCSDNIYKFIDENDYFGIKYPDRWETYKASIVYISGKHPQYRAIKRAYIKAGFVCVSAKRGGLKMYFKPAMDTASRDT